MLRKRAHRNQENRSMKRINSKEEVIPRLAKEKGDPDRSSTATIQSNCSTVSSPASIKERKRYGMKDFEELLRDEAFQKKALLRLTQNRCSESLECLLEIFKWENNEDNDRVEIANMIIETFVKSQSTKEVCLPCSLKTKLVENQTDENIIEMKTFLIRDLRFNDSLLSIFDS